MAGIIGFNNHASNYYVKGTYFTKVPFTKFQWTVSFNLTPTAVEQLNISQQDLAENLVYTAQSVDLPGWDVEQVLINQYNRKRVVNTTITYKQVTLTFFDTVDGFFRNFITSYMNLVSDNFSSDGVRAIKDRDLLIPEIKNNYGITAVDSVSGEDNFISYIQINQEYGGSVTPVRLLNPKISSVSRDTLDYTQQSGIVKWTIIVQPEGIEFLDSQVHPDYSEAAVAALYNPAPYSAGPNPGEGFDAGGDVVNGPNTNSVNNAIRSAQNPNAVLAEVFQKPGGSIPAGTAINGSTLGGIINPNSPAGAAIGKAVGAASSVFAVAGAITQLPGMQKYSKGPLGKIAQTGYKVKAVTGMVNQFPAAKSALDKYIKGFDIKRLGGGWL